MLNWFRKKKCKACNGKGTLYKVIFHNYFGRYTKVDYHCDVCKGKGKTETQGESLMYSKEKAGQLVKMWNILKDQLNKESKDT